MSTEPVGAAAPPVAAPVLPDPAADSTHDQIECAKQPAPTFLHSPPDSNNTVKSDGSDSELSDLDEEPVLDHPPALAVPPEPTSLPEIPKEAEQEDDDIGDVAPDHWSNGVPVFKPTMNQFKDFKLFMRKVDSYGMKSGIIKIVPPKEWKDAQPSLDDLVKQVRVREPIKQDIMGFNGTYRQVNILHGRSYNIPQWRQLCEQSEHQPPARRGERRTNAEKPRPTRTRAAAAAAATTGGPKQDDSSTPKKRGKGRPPKNKGKGKGKAKQTSVDDEQRPMTPVSPKVDEQGPNEDLLASVEDDLEVDDLEDQPPVVRRMGGIKPAKAKIQSTSARRKYSRREGSAAVDEEAFKDFDYRMDISEYTTERCEELERSYWKTLTYAQPLYGADLMGTLFDDRTESWNLNKLPNLLDVIGTKVPGVNTAYLYLGMWKATFAWHLEDVDLYSINYLHFGAPKQWYSISQADARRFEAAMKSIWPTDAKACDQFLRHKAFLISPQHLLQNYGIKVNKCVSYPGEFVVTYPYGYHSGYNLGYNCAEAVNFALDSWLEMGKIAKKCECAQAQDSVWVNVYEIERKLRGEETEYEETEDEEEEDEDEGDASGLPTPPASHGVKFKEAGRKRKRGVTERGVKIKVKKIKLRLKTRAEPPCCLCPNDIAGMEVLPTDDGRKAHRLCALYLPETYIDTVDDKEIVSNAARVHKDRLDLKCLFCRSKRGACFQCSQKKCARAYHATCAAAAGVFVEEEEVPVFGEDGTEYKEQAFEFSCRFHRTRRDKKLDGSVLEEDGRILAAAKELKKGEICQLQYYRGDIFAGIVVENRPNEESVLVDVLPNGDRVEVEWKWLLLPDASDYHLPKASANAIPMPTSQKAKDMLNAKRSEDEKPRKDDEFVSGFTWAEFHHQDVENKAQTKVNLDKQDQIWFYLGKTSTDAKAQYTENPSIARHNPKSNFLNTVPKPPKPPASKSKPMQQQAFPGARMYGYPYTGMDVLTTASTSGSARPEKPYVYKPKTTAGLTGMTPSYTPARFAPNSTPISAQWVSTSGHSGMPVTSLNSTAYYPAAYNGTPGQMQQSHQPLPQPALQIPQAQQATHSRSSPMVGLEQHAQQISLKPLPLASSTQQPGQQKKPMWQVYSSIYQKYAFFQVHHNRDSAKYRTPYAPWGGFTNGYQGDLRAHLMSNQSNQSDLIRRMSLSSLATSSGLAATGSYTSVYARPPSASQSPLAPSAGLPSVPYGSQGTLSPAAQKANTAAKPYQNNFQCVPQTQQPVAAPASKPKPAPVPKAYKVGLPAAFDLSLKSTKRAIQVPPKQSPVPLPANFLAAMTSSPATPSTASAKSVSLEDNSVSEVKVEGQTPPSTSTHVTSKPSQLRMSTTPVPLPKFPTLTPHQAASRINAATPGIPKDVVDNVLGNNIAIADQGEERLVKMGNCAAQQDPPGSSTAYMQPHPESTPQVLVRDQTQTVPRETRCASSQTLHAQETINGLTQTDVNEHKQPQEFPDVPGCESMEFVERMMQNLRRASLREHVA